MNRKRIFRAAVSVLLLGALLSGCAATVPCTPDAALSTLQKQDEIKGYIYETDTMLEFAPDEAVVNLLDGEWTKKDTGSKGTKCLSIIIDTQYELCFFADGSAMIYYGYAGIFEKDRAYYTYTPLDSVDALIAYITEHGVVTEEDEKAALPSAE